MPFLACVGASSTTFATIVLAATCVSPSLGTRIITGFDVAPCAATIVVFDVATIIVDVDVVADGYVFATRIFYMTFSVL